MPALDNILSKYPFILNNIIEVHFKQVLLIFEFLSIIII